MPVSILPLLAVCLSLAVLSGPAGPSECRLGPLVRLTHDGLDKYRPSWAPLGHRVLFARREPDGSHIWQYVLDVRNGKSSARRLTDRKGPEYHGVFSPDGSRVLFAAITPLRDTRQPRHRRGQRRRHGAEDGYRRPGEARAPGLAVLVARWPAVRIHLDPRGQPGDLHGGGRRHRSCAPDSEPGSRCASVLVARRPQDRLRDRSMGRTRAGRRQARRHGPRAVDQEPRSRRLPVLLARWLANCVCLQPRWPVRDLRFRSRWFSPCELVAPPAPRYLPDLDARTAAESRLSQTGRADSSCTRRRWRLGTLRKNKCRLSQSERQLFRHLISAQILNISGSAPGLRSLSPHPT